MPNPIFDRLALLTGEKGLEKLNSTSVYVFGAGGVGSWAAEALVRSGIGKIGIIDNDIICSSNVNRQVEATSLTIGQPKASALKKRLLEINPECEVTAWDEVFCRENADNFNIEKACYVIDAIDTLNHKLDLIETVYNANVTLFSSMGMALKTDPTQLKTASIWKTGNCPLARLVRQGTDPTQLKTASIWKTGNCPLARLVRQGLKKRGFTGDFMTVYSTEHPQQNEVDTSQSVSESGANPLQAQKKVNGSIVTVTASAGFILASLVLRDLLERRN